MLSNFHETSQTQQPLIIKTKTMSLALRYLPHYTIEDYKRWEGDWELINGIAYAMSPSPTKKHQRLSLSLARLFSDALEDACPNCEIIQELDWRVEENTVVRPDLMLICGEEDDDFVTSPPHLVIEILSPSTALKDKGLKHELYQEQGVKYYLIADPKQEVLQVYELIEGAYQLKKAIKTGDFEFKIETCTFAVHFESLWK